MEKNRVVAYLQGMYRSRALDGIGRVGEYKEYLAEDFMDDETVDEYKDDINIVRKEILEHIVHRYMIGIDAVYLSVYAHSLEAHAIQGGDDKVFYIDELLEGLILDYLFRCVSIAYDGSKENIVHVGKGFERMCNACILKHEFPEPNETDLVDLAKIPRAGLDIMADYYWCIVTFLMGHELYHLIETNESKDHARKEMMADEFGCQCLMDLIIDGEKGRISDRYHAFYLLYYMAPYLFFELYVFINKYRRKHGLDGIEEELFHARRDKVVDVLYEKTPDEFDTDEANELMNIMLDASDQLMEEVLEEKE